jgi:hypothetical protein
MNNGGRLCGMGLAALLLAGCHSKSDDRPPAPTPTPTPPQSYGASLTQVETTRVGDGQSLAVSGLPARGAELTVP